MKFEYMLGDKSLVVTINGQPYHVTRPTNEEQQRRWDAVKTAANNPDTTVEEMLALVSVKEAVETGVKNVPEVQLRDGRLYYNGEVVSNALADRIIDILQEGFPVEPWVKFAQNVYANPEVYSRDELYLFLEKSDLPITEDGHFLAYKNVSEDYRDIRTGTFDNTPGSICEMPRSEVDPNRNNTCSRGLHFAAKDYLRYYSPGRKTVVVKINPADVVSIPSDYDNAKGRTWRYEVVDEIPYEAVESRRWDPVVREDWSFENDDWDDEEEYCELCDEPIAILVGEFDGMCEDCYREVEVEVERDALTDTFGSAPDADTPDVPVTDTPVTPPPYNPPVDAPVQPNKGFKSWVLRKLGD